MYGSMVNADLQEHFLIIKIFLYAKIAAFIFGSTNRLGLVAATQQHQMMKIPFLYARASRNPTLPLSLNWTNPIE
ncbi:hypothetical protein ACLD72_013490 [Paenibacillus sp. TH7-28]